MKINTFTAFIAAVSFANMVNASSTQDEPNPGNWTKRYTLSEGSVLTHTPENIVIDGANSKAIPGARFVNRGKIVSQFIQLNEYNGFSISSSLKVTMSQETFEAVLRQSGLL
jgi:hypothetical protein